MIRHYLFPTVALLVLAIASTVSAQRPAATPAPTRPVAQPPQTAAATGDALPISKVAVVQGDMFLDEKTGINKFTSTLKKLNGEFQRQKDEITQMQTRATALDGEINKLRDAPAGTPIDQRSLQGKIDQLEQLKKDIQRKAEDAQLAYNRRQQELFSPIEEEVRRGLEAFAKARGITVIIDAGRVPLLYADTSIDVTRAFIADFNSKNPVAAAAATTPPE